MLVDVRVDVGRFFVAEGRASRGHVKNVAFPPKKNEDSIKENRVWKIVWKNARSETRGVDANVRLRANFLDRVFAVLRFFLIINTTCEAANRFLKWENRKNRIFGQIRYEIRNQCEI